MNTPPITVRIRTSLYPYRKYLRWMRTIVNGLRNWRWLPQDLKTKAVRWVHLLTLDPGELVEYHLPNSDIRMMLDLRDEIQMDIFLEGIYQAHVAATVLRYFSPSRSFVDIGANIGQYSVMLGSRIRDAHVGSSSPSAQPTVFAFEADPAIFQRLEQNVALNHLAPYVECLQNAVSDKQEVARFFRTQSNNSGGGSLANQGTRTQSGHAVEVETVTVDGCVLDRPCAPIGLIKLDIEGAELKALRGATQILHRDQPILILEASSTWMQAFGYTYQDLHAFLRAHDYAIHLIDRQGRLVPEQDAQLPHEFNDLVCIPPARAATS